MLRRALHLIHQGSLDEGSVGGLAERVGVGTRHLNRLFTQHLGASPITIAQTRRLQFAKRLLDETDLAITEVALASGCGSVRRFNHCFLQTYRRSPREVRNSMLKRHARSGRRKSFCVLPIGLPSDHPED